MTKFATHAVLSVCTGKLMGEMTGVYDVIGFLVGRGVYTHELPDYAEASRYVLHKSHPNLPTKEYFENVNRDNYKAYRSEWEEKLGEEFELDDSLRGILTTGFEMGKWDVSK